MEARHKADHMVFAMKGRISYWRRLWTILIKMRLCY